MEIKKAVEAVEKKTGIDLPDEIITEDECVEALEKLLAGDPAVLMHVGINIDTIYSSNRPPCMA